MQWREWSGYFASSVYADFHDIEYNAIREAAALIDVSPLYKYRVAADARRLVDRVITRDATKLAAGSVIYTPWCDEHGKVDRRRDRPPLDDGSFRWTAADPQLRWLRHERRGLDVDDREETEAVAALALQGPLSRAVLEARPASRSRPALLPAPARTRPAAEIPTCRGPATPATSATSCGSRRARASRSGTR
jgi:aminomethyltransferase